MRSTQVPLGRTTTRKDPGVSVNCVVDTVAESDDAAASVGVMGCPIRITNILFHVWVKNEEAIRFYTEMNYVDTKVIKHYYERIEEPHAVCMEKRLE
ncbi:MAG: uncharacterized protein KVP18_000190 [Porospora cf. gigantea A]|uniref:uncharacterized protein n=1 Tax=Porospora cf. gigantea A TaxID=2853593 RepID=UPI00355A544C|nr:MAG: hypothetical protein KVP18_000190 [Porospora cf. gigantea A]